MILALALLERDRSYKQQSICHLELSLHYLDQIGIHTKYGTLANSESTQAIDQAHQLYQEALTKALLHVDKAYFRLSIQNRIDEVKAGMPRQIVNFASLTAINERAPTLLHNAKSSTRAMLSLISQEQNNLNKMMVVLIIGCGVMLAIAYTGTHINNYYRFIKPQKSHTHLLESALNGKITESELLTHIATKSQFGGVLHRTISAIRNTERFVTHLSSGNFDLQVDYDNNDHFQNSLKSMQEKLKEITLKEKTNALVNENLNALEKLIKVESDTNMLYEKVIALLTKGSSSTVGILYAINDENSNEPFLFQLSSFGYLGSKSRELKTVRIGEGQLGQAVVDKKTVLLSNLPDSYVKIQSGLGASSAHYILIVPLIFKNDLYGALELASFSSFEKHHVQFIEKAAESLAAHLFNHKVNDQAKRNLEKLADKQAKELVEIHRLQEKTYKELELKLTEVEDEKYKNEAILEGCVDAVICFDSSGKINFCNKACEEVFGYSKAHLREVGIFNLIPMRVDNNENHRCFYVNGGTEKEIGVRTEACITSMTGDAVDVLITSTTVDVNHKALFTFFIQKISVDLF